MISTTKKKTLRQCKFGHSYYKSSDCPVCHTCEANRISEIEFLNQIVAPARRALENAGINSLKQLSKYTIDEMLALHGMGKSTIPKLEMALKLAGLKFKK